MTRSAAKKMEIGFANRNSKTAENPIRIPAGTK
jgi:hypothetical protein